MAQKLSDAEQQNVTTSHIEAAYIIPFSLAVFNEREVFALPSYTNFLTNPLNSVTLEQLLGMLYSEPSLVLIAFLLKTLMILAMCYLCRRSYILHSAASTSA
jgi:hypothetical protein